MVFATYQRMRANSPSWAGTSHNTNVYLKKFKHIAIRTKQHNDTVEYLLFHQFNQPLTRNENYTTHDL